MDPAKLAALGETLEPGRRPPAPGSLRVVQQFLNTRIHEPPIDVDRLADLDEAGAWLVGHGLLVPPGRLTPAAHRRVVRFRNALRAFVADGPEPEVVGELATAGSACLRAGFEPDGRVRLVAGDDADDAIGPVLARVVEASISGTLGRLKTCGRCGWAFYDRSRNRSGSWCAMTVCGNRTKNRVYRRRRGASGPGRPTDRQ
jgi:hypothetical protein